MITVNLPTIKRIPGDFDTFQQAVEVVGFEEKSSMGNRVYYHENDVGMGITVVDGLRANLILPSGPVRGRLLSQDTASATDQSGFEDLMEEIEQELEDEANQPRRGEAGRRNEFQV